jgi:hypothetical protein
MPGPTFGGKPTFGAGRVFATLNVVNPTPARALVPQSQGFDFKRKTESLVGENQFPVAVGAGDMEVTGKVEYGETQARVFADIMFGDAGVTGSYIEADGEAGTVAASSPYKITVANSADWIQDLGVINVATGAIYARVAASSEVEGKSYSVAAGVYTFAAGDTGVNMKISYLYTDSTDGETVVMTNQMQGLIGNFKAVHVLPWGTQQDIFVFNSCIASANSVSLKKSGFASQSLDYMAFTDSTDSLGTATFAVAA